MNDIFSYIIEQETAYDLPVSIVDNWDWNMKEHIELSILYKNSQLSTGKNDNKPVKNITRPILNLQYRAEGFDVKDIDIYVDNIKDHYKSFFIKKYHDKWAREQEIDTFIDEVVESYVDFGGALVKNVNQSRPEVVPLQSLAFCDQTDLLSGPFAIKHYFNPEQLKDMEEKGWGKESNGATVSIDDLIELAEPKKEQGQDDETVDTPSKYIELYEVHGVMPSEFLNENDEDKYIGQMHIVGFYRDEKGHRHGVTLFKGKEKELPFKLLLRDAIYGRALGLGGAEELFEPQVWTNYGLITMKSLLDGASKVLHITDDTGFFNRNRNLSNVQNNEVLVVDEGKTVRQMDTIPRNITIFQNSVAEWEEHARVMASANESILGESPKSGTPFKLQELVTAESHSLHEYRKGKIATFIEEVYRDWIIPHLSKEVVKEQEFLVELDVDEMQEISKKVAENVANRKRNEAVLNGEIPPNKDMLVEEGIDNFTKTGNKKFLKILEGEMKKAPLTVKVSIVGKQKNLALVTDKLSNIFRTVISAPQILQNPAMAKLFNSIIENSGLEPIDFSGFTAVPELPEGQPVEPPQKLLPTEQPVA